MFSNREKLGLYFLYIYIYDIYCNVCSGSIWRAQSFGDDLKYIFTYLIIFALIMTIQYTYFR